MGICASTKEVGEDPIEELGKRMDNINIYYPGTDFSCLMDSNGDIVVDKNFGSSKEAADVLQNVFLMKKASKHFSKTIDSKCRQCEIVHIRGEYTILSMWIIKISLNNDDENVKNKSKKNYKSEHTFVLMFKTKMMNNDPMRFDIDKTDKKMNLELMKEMTFYLKMHVANNMFSK